MHRCLICQRSFDKKRSLANHIRTHGMTPTEYKKKFFAELHENLTEGVDYIICPICGKERWGQITRHLHRQHSLTDEQIKELGIKTVTDKYSQYYTARTVALWNKLDREAVGKAISKTKSERWTEEDSKRLHEARIATGAYSRIGRARNQHLIDKFDTYESYLHNLIGRRGKRIPGRDSHRYVVYRSTWEKRLSEILDSLHIEYSYEPFAVKYVLEGKEKHYLPDFYIESKNLVLEVKPEKMSILEVSQVKKQAVLDAGYRFEFITEDRLNEEYVQSIMI